MEEFSRARQFYPEASRRALFEKLRSDGYLYLCFELRERAKRDADVTKEHAISTLRVSLGNVAGDRGGGPPYLRCQLEAMRWRQLTS